MARLTAEATMAALFGRQPSTAQIEKASAILSDEAHPFRSGEPVHGFTARMDDDGIFRLAVRVMQDPDEIWATPVTRCFLIGPEGDVVRVKLDRWLP